MALLGPVQILPFEALVASLIPKLIANPQGAVSPVNGGSGVRLYYDRGNQLLPLNVPIGSNLINDE
jgi:hypothetical protein